MYGNGDDCGGDQGYQRRNMYDDNRRGCMCKDDMNVLGDRKDMWREMMNMVSREEMYMMVSSRAKQARMWALLGYNGTDELCVGKTLMEEKFGRAKEECEKRYRRRQRGDKFEHEVKSQLIFLPSIVF